MIITEKLSHDQIEQLFEMYEDVWFTQGRELNDVVIMLENSYLTLGFLDGNELVGFCRAISDGVYKAFIFDVIVKESYQEQGVGKKIVETLLAHDKMKDVGHIELYCPEKLTPFYEKFGFEVRTSLLMRNSKS